MPAQWDWVLEETRLTADETAEAAWAITPNGERYQGAAAISVAFDELIGFGRLVYVIYRLPGIRHIEDWVYRFVANNRMLVSRWLSSTPAIKQSEWKPER